MKFNPARIYASIFWILIILFSTNAFSQIQISGQEYWPTDLGAITKTCAPEDSKCWSDGVLNCEVGASWDRIVGNATEHFQVFGKVNDYCVAYFDSHSNVIVRKIYIYEKNSENYKEQITLALEQREILPIVKSYFCGDGKCESSEDSSNCPKDCTSTSNEPEITPTPPSSEPKGEDNPPVYGSEDLIADIVNLIANIVNSFTFTNYLQVLLFVVLLIGVWFSYKLLLPRIQAVRKRRKLVKKIVFAIIILIIASHIKINSFIGVYADWLLFLAGLYVVLGVFWFLLKWIDSLDLRSDLNLWILRIAGGIVSIIGLFLLFATGVSMFFVSPPIMANNLFWIASIFITLLGAFSTFRSYRRYPMIKIW